MGNSDFEEEVMTLAKLDVVVLDCPDPHALAAFYAEVLGGTVRSTHSSPSSLCTSTVPPSTSA